jgi:hypothetical protein
MKEFFSFKQAIKLLESEYLKNSLLCSQQRLSDLNSSLKQIKQSCQLSRDLKIASKPDARI